MLEKEKDLLMLFHTGTRNVFTMTGVSLGILGYSRFYRKKGNDLYNLSFIIISTITLAMSIHIASHIYNDIEDYMKENELDQTSKIHKLLIIPKTMRIVNTVILIFGLYTFQRQYALNV
tara:strand:- start:673 stop:1029 length:357 start_codon:yes stop_codon:yes gene_type:complete